MMKPALQSLRVRLLVPLVLAACVAAVAVAGMSAWLGARGATSDVQQRFLGISKTLRQSSFPLTDAVLNWLANLTGTELLAFNQQQRLQSATLQLDANTATALLQRLTPRLTSHEPAPGVPVVVAGTNYLAFGLQRPHHNATTQSQTVIILFAESALQSARWRAAIPPLATGLTTVILLSSVTLTMIGRLIHRLQNLESRVGRVAAGEFDLPATEITTDEVGRLAIAVDSMGQQLDQLWQALHRRQRERLLHQIACGMAHQLRNSLTGARLAIELHAQACPSSDGEDMQVAIAELERIESYVRRLLLVGAGRQEADQVANVAESLEAVAASLEAVARHAAVKLNWIIEDRLGKCDIGDGPIYIAAISNLVLNAIQAGQVVEVSARLLADSTVEVSVCDDGPGVPDELSAVIFEPFETSKPEGLGLGLPLVRRSAEHLSGEAHWHRQGGRTVFTFLAPCTRRCDT